MKKFLLLFCWLCSAAYAESFIAKEDVPKSLAFLPPPPTLESFDFARDQATYLQTRSLKGSDRWRQATFDADFRNKWPDFFKDALGFSLDKQKTPTLYTLIERMIGDAVAATETAKTTYRRVRPFAYFGQDGGTCTPADEEGLKTDGSYPSGHTTLGWSMALILAEAAPARKEAILRRGHEYGISRVICGAHWQSDVEAGFLVASAVVAQLHNSPEFQKMLQTAKTEVANLQKALK